MKTFGSLVKGLQIGIDLLNILWKEDHEILSLSKVVNLPTLSSLDELVHQFEVALDDDFPQYQVICLKNPSNSCPLKIGLSLFF